MKISTVLTFAFLLISCATTTASEITKGGVYVLATEYKFSAEMIDWTYERVVDATLSLTDGSKSKLMLAEASIFLHFVQGSITCGPGQAIGCFTPWRNLIEVTYITPKQFHSFGKVHCILAHEMTHFVLRELGIFWENLLHASPYFGAGDTVETRVCTLIYGGAYDSKTGY